MYSRLYLIGLTLLHKCLKTNLLYAGYKLKYRKDKRFKNIKIIYEN